MLQNTYINENESIRVNLLGIEADSDYQKERRGSNSDKLSDENLLLILKKAGLNEISLDDKAKILSGGQV